MAYIRVAVTRKLTGVNAIIEELKSNCGNVGGISIFVGVVRKYNFGKRVTKLIYEAHEELAKKMLEEITREILEKYSLLGAVVEHRIGELEVGEKTMIVALASEHRMNSFLGLIDILDKIKTGIPIWKKEVRENGEVWLKHVEEKRVSVYIDGKKIDVPKSFLEEFNTLLKKYFGDISTKDIKIFVG